MKSLRLFLASLLVCFAVFGLFHVPVMADTPDYLTEDSEPVSPKAVCTHRDAGPRQQETSHPHEYYNVCNLCGEKIMHEQYATLPHGPGSGSGGTCQYCGSHSYSGRSCTNKGTCSCGATIAAYGHAYGTAGVQYETAHPHSEYMRCTRCGYKNYTGTYETVAHGDGTNGTCPSCGEHEYVLSSQSTHPHRESSMCACGDGSWTYGLSHSCTTCTANLQTFEGEWETTFNLTCAEGGIGGGAIVSVPVTLVSTFRNGYNDPAAASAPYDYDYPRYACWACSISSVCQKPINITSPIQVMTGTSVRYFNSSNVQVGIQSLSLTGNSANVTSGSLHTPFTLPATPDYVQFSVSAMSTTTGSQARRTATVYFP